MPFNIVFLLLFLSPCFCNFQLLDAANLPDGVSILVPTPSYGPNAPTNNCQTPYNVVVNPVTGVIYASCFGGGTAARGTVGVIAIRGSSVRTVISDSQCSGPKALAIGVSQNILAVVCQTVAMVFMDLRTSLLISTAPKISIANCPYAHSPVVDDSAPIVYVACYDSLGGPPADGSVLAVNVVAGTITILASSSKYRNPEWLSLDTRNGDTSIVYAGGAIFMPTVQSVLLSIQSPNITILAPDAGCKDAYVQVHPVTGVLYVDCRTGILKGKGTFAWNSTTNNLTLVYPSCAGRKVWDMSSGLIYTRCGPSELSFLRSDNPLLLPILPDNIPVSSFCLDKDPDMPANPNAWDVNLRTGMVYLACFDGPGVLAINVTTLMKNVLPPTSPPGDGGDWKGSTGEFVSSSVSLSRSSTWILILTLWLFPIVRVSFFTE